MRIFYLNLGNGKRPIADADLHIGGRHGHGPGVSACRREGDLIQNIAAHLHMTGGHRRFGGDALHHIRRVLCDGRCNGDGHGLSFAGGLVVAGERRAIDTEADRAVCLRIRCQGKVECFSARPSITLSRAPWPYDTQFAGSGRKAAFFALSFITLIEVREFTDAQPTAVRFYGAEVAQRHEVFAVEAIVFEAVHLINLFDGLIGTLKARIDIHFIGIIVTSQVVVERTNETVFHHSAGGFHHFHGDGRPRGVADYQRGMPAEPLAFNLRQYDALVLGVDAGNRVELQIVVPLAKREGPLVEVGRIAGREGDLRLIGNTRL